MSVIKKMRAMRADQLPDAWRSIPQAALTLMAPNVADGWQDREWRTWDAPVSIVHGESHHRDALRLMTGPPRRCGYLVPVDVVLRREPANEYDANAVRVEALGQLVGYIARDMAADVSGALVSCGAESCTFAGLLRGGYDGRSSADVGVMVWLDKRVSAAPRLDFGSVVRREWQWPPDDDEGRG